MTRPQHDNAEALRCSKNGTAGCSADAALSCSVKPRNRAMFWWLSAVIYGAAILLIYLTR